MGYAGKLSYKLQAQALRKEGLSYREILKTIPVSKDTISRWCRDILLTQKQKDRLLNNKIFGQKKGSLVAAENKRNKRIEKTNKIFILAKSDLGLVNKRDRFIAGIALYAGEGDKSDGKGAFTNSRPDYIKFMMGWFKEFCAIPKSSFRGAIWLHEGLNELDARKYWSNITGIPIDKFHKTYIVKNKPDSNKVRKNLHKNGVFSIRFSGSDQQRRILGWISALLGDKMPQVLSVP